MSHGRLLATGRQAHIRGASARMRAAARSAAAGAARADRAAPAGRCAAVRAVHRSSPAICRGPIRSRRYEALREHAAGLIRVLDDDGVGRRAVESAAQRRSSFAAAWK